MPIYMVTKGVVQGLIRGGVTQGVNDGAWEVDSFSFGVGRSVNSSTSIGAPQFSTVTVTFPWAPNLPRLLNAFKNEEKFKPILIKLFDAQDNLQSHITLEASAIIDVGQNLSSDSLPRYTIQIGFSQFKWSTDLLKSSPFTFDVLTGVAS